MKAKRKYIFRDGKTLALGETTLVMGILNVTPDSFFDGGKYTETETALDHAKELVAGGADIIDVGAQSTRPGSENISPREEQRRLKKILPALIKSCPVPVSIDTFHAETAEMAAKMGVHILNDVEGLQYENEPGEMARVAAAYDLPTIVMHSGKNADYGADIIGAMKKFFRRSLVIADEAKLPRENIILDPGIGFGKTAEQNLFVLQKLHDFTNIDGEIYPVLAGVSNKSFIGKTLALDKDERTEATGAACVLAAAFGASIVRVHDAKSISRMCRMTDAILAAKER